MSPSERKTMINRDRTDLSLTKQCKLLKISRSSLYYVPFGVNAETSALISEIDRVFMNYPFFGSRQIAAYLLRKLPITRPNHVWCSDIAYIPVRRGFLYLVAIIDWVTRKVLAWRLLR
ncbi:DDE-type integrase/transposase/recombinase [Roseobacter sp.]|uniref:DDE-type integrase/transposase/recombinase n=1 Tax=Roseobacter sp. TaxID=1907202 RepID=UPI0032988245